MAPTGLHLTPERRAAIEERLRQGHATNTIAREMGASFTTVRNIKAGIESQPKPAPPPVQYPTFPEPDLPIETIIGTMAERSRLRIQAAAAREWMPIKINSTSPAVIAFVGDPHFDDDGTDWNLLQRDIELMKLEHVYSVNIGDSTNNWAGKLMRLYAEQETSRRTARKLAKWFLAEAGIKWLVWLMGNHDEWEQGSDILRLMNTTGLPMEDWQAKFKVVFPSRLEVPIWASHDFKGSSIWNPGHGNMRTAKMRGGAALYVSGHRHTWHLHSEEMPDTGEVFWTMRARGYKFLDKFANRHGFSSDKYGATMAAVIDPRAATIHEALTCFPDLERAIMFRDAIA